MKKDSTCVSQQRQYHAEKINMFKYVFQKKQKKIDRKHQQQWMVLPWFFSF